MVERLIRLALHHPWIVLASTVTIVVLGIYSYQNEKIDAYPDISGQMVQILTTFPGRAPEEVEQQVTIPIEFTMGNVPRVNTIRSRTIFGLSVVQLSFEEGVDGYWARQRVLERLAALQLPSGATAELGPLATAYGEVYRYELRTNGNQDLMELRTINDWVVFPNLIRTPGVADVANFGGLLKQYTVLLEPGQLEHFGLTLNDVVTAIKANNANAGGSVISRGSMSLVIRGRGALKTEDDIREVFINSVGGTPIYVRDVGTVALDSMQPSGIFSKAERPKDGEESQATPIAGRESVEGIVLMRKGENPSDVLERVKATVDELNKNVLPSGVKIVPFYDREMLISSTLHTVTHSVVTGILLVVLVLLVFLGSLRMASIVALTIPFSLLFALVLMYTSEIPIGLLSIGAIDFGIIVDGAVIMADHIAERLHHACQHQKPGEKLHVRAIVQAAAMEVQRPVFFAIAMIIGAYLPLLTLTRIEGLLFRPMALTLVFALLGALIFALLVVPVLCVILFPRGYVEFENPLLTAFRRLYGGVLYWLLQARWMVLALMVALLARIFLYVVPNLGIEFLPYMDEGVIWVRANFPEGTSLQQNNVYGLRMQEVIRQFADINFVTVQSGRSDANTDPFPPSRMEMMIGPKPREEWVEFRTKRELIDAIGSRLRGEFPTTRFNFTQPIIDSVTEDTNGTSANLAVEFSGRDSDKLLELARKTVDLVRRVPGSVDVNIEQEGPQPQLVIQPDRALCSRYDVSVEDLAKLINTAVGGEPIGVLYEGERRFDIVCKFSREYLTSPQAVERLPVPNPKGIPIQLSQVANISVRDGQTLIARDSGRRRLTVRTDIVGRDQGSFVAEAQRMFAKEIQPECPEDIRVRWIGMFENLERARKHFAVVMPVTVALIYVLLVVTFRTQAASLLVLLSVPFAFVGGAMALHFRHMNFNVSTGVGFAALFGVSIMNGVLMVRWITELRLKGLSVEEAIIEGALNRLRPILMASMVAILGLLPASIATGLGSDVQRPMATVIVWGLFSSTILTLFVVPVLYRIVSPGLPKAEEPDDAPPLDAESSQHMIA
jgi:cobalt-zinc-cadmium resistance protein CzcA